MSNSDLKRRLIRLEASEARLQRTATRLQRECDRYTSELERKVAARTAELNALKERLQAENEVLREELRDLHAYGEVIGNAPALKRVVRQIRRVAPTDATVLILGESGTGKGLIAREIHRHSPRAEQPMIKVNCATIPRELYESEFFGHVKGAFTGATRDRAGRFEAADGGTLFLDEVAEIPLELQGKLLRVLQDGEYERIGEERLRRVDVRVVAATNQNLKARVADKRFREDLYYRINVFPVEMPPLRERREDIVALARAFLRQTARRLNRPAPSLSRANAGDLTAHDWPGNVRELQNAVERAVILSDSGRLRFDHLRGEQNDLPGVGERAGHPDRPVFPGVLSEAEMKGFQRNNMIAALKSAGWKIYGPDGAAQLLGINPTTLIERMKRAGIRKPARQDRAPSGGEAA